MEVVFSNDCYKGTSAIPLHLMEMPPLNIHLKVVNTQVTHHKCCLLQKNFFHIVIPKTVASVCTSQDSNSAIFNNFKCPMSGRVIASHFQPLDNNLFLRSMLGPRRGSQESGQAWELPAAGSLQSKASSGRYEQ